MSKKGSAKQEKFINAYDGKIEPAADAAGLSYTYCRLLVTKPDIIARIKERAESQSKPTIATRQQRQEFWTKTMQDEGEDMKHRQRASELLGKSEADFTDKVEHSGGLTVKTTRKRFDGSDS